MRLLIYAFLVSSVTATPQFYDLGNVLAFLEKNFGIQLSQNHKLEKAPPKLATRQLNGLQTVQVNTKACPHGTVLNIAGSCIEPVVERKVFLFSLPEEKNRNKKVIVNPRSGYKVILLNKIDRTLDKEKKSIPKVNHLQSSNVLKDGEKIPSVDVTTKPIDFNNHNELSVKTLDHQNQLELIKIENGTKFENSKDVVTDVPETGLTQEPNKVGEDTETLSEFSEAKNENFLPSGALGTAASSTFEQSELSDAEIPTQMTAASISNYEIETEKKVQAPEIPKANQNPVFSRPFGSRIPQSPLIPQTKGKHRNEEIYYPSNPSLTANTGSFPQHSFFHNAGYNQRPNVSPVLLNPSNAKVFPNNFFRPSFYPVFNNIVPNSLRFAPFVNTPAYKHPQQSISHNLPFLNNGSPSQRPGFVYLPFWKTASKLDRFPFLALSRSGFQNQRFPFSSTTPLLTRQDQIHGINSQVNSILSSNPYRSLGVSNTNKIIAKKNDFKTTTGSRLNNDVENALNSGGGNLPNLPIQVAQFRQKPHGTHSFAKVPSFALRRGSGLKSTQSQFTLNQQNNRPIQSKETKVIQAASLDLQNLPPTKVLNNQDVNKSFRPLEEQAVKEGYRNQEKIFKERKNDFLKPKDTQSSQIESERDKISTQTDVIYASDVGNFDSPKIIKSDQSQITTHEGLVFGTEKKQSTSSQTSAEDNSSYSVDIFPHQKVFSAGKDITTPVSVSGESHFKINQNLKPSQEINASPGLETDVQTRTESKKTELKSKEDSSKAFPTTEGKSRLPAPSDSLKRAPLVTSESRSKAFVRSPLSFSGDPKLNAASFRSGNNKESFIKINFGSIKDFPSVYVDLSKKPEHS